MARTRRRSKSDSFPVGIVFVIIVITVIIQGLKWLDAHPDVIVYLIFAVGGILAIRQTIKQKKQAKWLSSGIAEIDQMSGTEFEERLLWHFQSHRWKLKMTPGSGDMGADLVGTDAAGRRVVIQAKRYNGTVGVKAVQEVVGAKSYYKAVRMMVVTNSHLTKQAWELARANGVEVWERERLVGELGKK